jgi:predicted nucleotide-binding protein
MNQTVVERLEKLLKNGEDVDAEWQFDRWTARVAAFLETTLGPDEADLFSKLPGENWFEKLPLQLGRLEGLIVSTGINLQSSSIISTLGPTAPTPVANGRKVFVVHGHDEAAKDSSARFLERLGLTAIILHEQPNAGRSIIEKFETYSGDVVFAVVLLTPDDIGSTASQASNLNKRARQNVIMELGYFIGRLGRTRVCALHKGDVELPSDYQGVLYIEMDSAGAWKAKLAQELVQSKIAIELTGLLGS